MISAYRYCPLCGASLVERVRDQRRRAVCDACGFVHYRNPAPAAGVVVVENGRVLLVRRKFEPRMGGWTLPAGFIEHDEAIEACAAREAKEETNLDVEITGLFDAYTADDDPRTPVVLLLFNARRVGGDPRAGDDASEVGFFELDRLPDPIAFSAHRRALDAIRRRETTRR